MPTQDKDTEMAIPSQPRKLARKLMQTDLSAYAMGKAAKEGIKKFTAKLPLEVSDYPADDAESNNARFKGGKVNKDNTRKADYKTGGDENAYESVMKRKLIEKFSKMAVVSTKKPIVSTIFNIGPQGKKSIEKVVKSNEETIAEAGEPMSPAPATSDNPGFSGDSAMATDNGADNEKTNNSGDEENENVNGVREKLENIAMMSAEMFENLQDDAELEKWVLEKLELAHDFIEAVSKEINDSNGGDDEEDGEPEGNQGGKDDNNNAKPSAFKGNGEQSMAKEEVELDEGNSTKDYFRHLHRINELGGNSKKVKEHIQNYVPTDVLKSIHRNMDKHQHSDLFAAEIARRKANPDIKIKRVPKMDPHSQKTYDTKGVAGYHEEVELDEATEDDESRGEEDDGWYTHREIHGKNAVSREDWKKGIRKPKAPVKESSLGDMLGSEEGVKKIAPKKDEYGNEIKNPARSLARKAMKTFATKKGA